METGFGQKYKTAIDFLKNSGVSSLNKPAIPHLLRVGEYLFKKGFGGEVVTAGLLHDVLEWSSVTEKELEEKFGKRVLEHEKPSGSSVLYFFVNLTPKVWGLPPTRVGFWCWGKFILNQ